MSTTYLSRPVFDFRVNWAENPEPSFSYDLRETRTEWGPLAFAMLQRDVARGWQFQLLLKTLAEIVAFETFCDAARGRLNGFWFPSPDNFVTPIEGSGDELVIEDIGLRDRWDLGAPLHLWINLRNEGPTAYEVTDVVAGDAGQEIVTLSANLPADFDATWRVQRLLYVRFLDDTEKWTWLDEGMQRRQIRVIELPREYVAAETGELKVYLYQFSYAPPGTAPTPAECWHYTSFQSAITSTYNGAMTGQAHASRTITHGSLKRSTENPSVETTLSEIHYDAEGPWARDRREGYPTLWVRIYSAAYATPNSTTLLFTGEVRKWKSKGKKLSAPCIGGISAGTQRLPVSKRGATCGNTVFDAARCKLSDAAHKVTATVTAVDGLAATLNAAGFAGKAANHYARGRVSTGSGRDLRHGTAVASTAASGNNVDLLLNHDLHLEVDDVVEIWPGCDGLEETCKNKFNNFVNFDGQPLVPVTNPASDQLSTTPTNANKK